MYSNSWMKHCFLLIACQQTQHLANRKTIFFVPYSYPMVFVGVVDIRYCRKAAEVEWPPNIDIQGDRRQKYLPPSYPIAHFLPFILSWCFEIVSVQVVYIWWFMTEHRLIQGDWRQKYLHLTPLHISQVPTFILSWCVEIVSVRVVYIWWFMTEHWLIQGDWRQKYPHLTPLHISQVPTFILSWCVEIVSVRVVNIWWLMMRWPLGLCDTTEDRFIQGDWRQKWPWKTDKVQQWNRSGGYLEIRDNFADFSIKTYVAGTHDEAILMSTHNMFYGELTKIILELSSNTLLICSTEIQP